MKLCPRCRSDAVKTIDYLGTDCTVCQACGYDERETLDVFPEERTNQKVKSRHSPYKKGGSLRIQKN